MFKFIKKYAETIDHVEIYPIISLIIFFAFFVTIIWYVLSPK
jgi:cytochrome c oxidase cbb3-type subunit 4